MKLDLDEAHVYFGAVVLALGAGVAAGTGVGLIVFGAVVIGVGIFRMLGPDAPPAPRASSSAALTATLVQGADEEEEEE